MEALKLNVIHGLDYKELAHILTNTTKEEMHNANIEQHAPYIRLLGMSQKDKLTFQKQEKIELPILTHTKLLIIPL